MQNDPEHIIVVGDVRGQWELLAQRLEEIIYIEKQIKVCFCVGTSFGEGSHGLDAFMNGDKTFPIPVYFICGNETFSEPVNGIPNGGEILPNLNYLGRFGIKSVEGLRVCFLSGVFDPEKFVEAQKSDTYSSNYTAADLKAVQVSFQGVDVLLTAEWPSNVHKNIIEVDLPKMLNWRSVGSTVVENLANKCAPRSHFAATQGVYFTPRAHRNHEHSQSTNFVGLAPFNNEQKKRYIYAAKIIPLEGQTDAQIRRQSPLDVRTCPYPAPPSKRRKLLEKSGLRPPDGYMCGLCGSSAHWFRQCSRYKEPSEFRALQEEVYGFGTGPKGCGYCFHSQGVSKELIVSVGLHCYLTLSRTPVVPNHFFIVPNEHVRSSAEYNANQQKEVDQYIRALAKCFHPLVLLIFERNMKLEKHGYLEIVPVVRGQLPQIAEVLRLYERKFNIAFQRIDQDVNLVEMIGEYGYLSLGTNEGQRYLHVVDPTKPRIRNDVLRKMVCKIMGFPDTYNYTKQRTSKEDQGKIVAMVKEKFGPFDPFMEKRYSIPTIKNKIRIKKQVVEVNEDADPMI